MSAAGVRGFVRDVGAVKSVGERRSKILSVLSLEQEAIMSG